MKKNLVYILIKIQICVLHIPLQRSYLKGLNISFGIATTQIAVPLFSLWWWKIKERAFFSLLQYCTLIKITLLFSLFTPFILLKEYRI